MLQNIEGIILRTQDYGETHKIITIFTEDRGKVAVMARGAKKPKSRMAAIAQPFIYGSFLVQIGSGMGAMQQGEPLQSFRGIREDIVKTAYASYIAEMTDKLTDNNKPDPDLFRQLLQVLEWINDGKDADVLRIIYELKMFRRGGFAPAVHQCVNCGNTELPYKFSIPEGGMLCRRCMHLDHDAYVLSDKVTKLLQLFTSIDITRIGNISVKPETKRLLNELLDAYYERYGGYFLKSKKFLSQLDKLQ
ncbi:DNA repair protein RecO [Terribacillus sp. DMT04]|uniref:DNA repair protein RecO n=1 Tax=Terribacillus sp. DMT04 TaxID=2850441 RepID=UPI001C2B7C0C|nr:DNA repair protein RecO [Terribacillus sp. DMT04]QXE00458.1 DNA repair protein RecO [Terribacillus sp. DMT04]